VVRDLRSSYNQIRGVEGINLGSDKRVTAFIGPSVAAIHAPACLDRIYQLYPEHARPARFWWTPQILYPRSLSTCLRPRSAWSFISRPVSRWRSTTTCPRHSALREVCRRPARRARRIGAQKKRKNRKRAAHSGDVKDNHKQSGLSPLRVGQQHRLCIARPFGLEPGSSARRARLGRSNRSRPSARGAYQRAQDRYCIGDVTPTCSRRARSLRLHCLLYLGELVEFSTRPRLIFSRSQEQATEDYQHRPLRLIPGGRTEMLSSTSSRAHKEVRRLDTRSRQMGRARRDPARERNRGDC